MATYQTRLEKLEARHAPASDAPQRFVVEFVNKQREAVTLVADGQWFHRAEGESEDQFHQRARRAVALGY